MAYDSKTYGQSPFGNPKKPDGPENAKAKIPTTPIDDGLDQGPGEFSTPPPASPATPSKAKVPRVLDDRTTGATSDDTSAPKPAIPASVTQIANRLGLGKAVESALGVVSGTADTSIPSRTSRTTATSAAKTSAKSTAKKSTSKKSTKRKNKKTKAAELAQAEVEAAEAEVARRFYEEDRSAYISLLYKTGISGLVWAVLRLSRNELSDNAIDWINVIVHPVLISTVALIAMVSITFWTRRVLTDLAYHTRQLSEDAETSEGQNYRPTLEIVGDALEYNPKLRSTLTRIFDATSTVICTLISYLITSFLLP